MHARSSWSIGSALVAAELLAGCSHFHSSKKLDTGPFAENTVSMAGEIQRYNRPPHWIYLNEFRSRPSVEAARKTAVVLRDLLRNICLYSVQVVALHEARMDESRKVAELARYLDEVSRPGIAAGSAGRIGLTDSDFRSVLASIRSKKTLREAFGVAQPLVTAVAKYANDVFDQADTGVADACEDVKEQIELKFEPMLHDLREIEGLQLRLTRGFGLLYDIRGGRSGALAKLLEADPELQRLLPAEGEPTAALLDQAEDRVFTQLQRVKQVREDLEPQFRSYKEHQRELEALRLQTEEMLRLGRLAISVWTRSHRNLAAGIPVPPDIDVIQLLQGAAKLGKQVL